MFSLIITIISIALVAALAVATIYYGGSAFTQGTAKANASAFVAAGQQVNGALALYANDNGGARATDAQLVPTYLAATPSVQAKALTVSTYGVTATGISLAVCDAINTSAGLSGAAVPAALPTSTAEAAAIAAPFACAKAATGATSGDFIFKG